MLDAHNARRQEHGAPPLTWDEQLARAAEAYASQLAAGGCYLRHDEAGGAFRDWGENLYGVGGFPPPDSQCAAAMGPWYSVGTGVGAVQERCRGELIGTGRWWGTGPAPLLVSALATTSLCGRSYCMKEHKTGFDLGSLTFHAWLIALR